jgi:hypothetical protein
MRGAAVSATRDLYGELDDDRWEVRKVEVSRDGRITCADGRGSSGDTVLGESPLPSVEQIAADPVFEVVAISRAEFETVWDQAHDDARDQDDRPA